MIGSSYIDQNPEICNLYGLLYIESSFMLRDLLQISLLILSEFTHLFLLDPFSTHEYIKKP